MTTATAHPSAGSVSAFCSARVSRPRRPRDSRSAFLIRDSAAKKETSGPLGSAVARLRPNRAGPTATWQTLVVTSCLTRDLRFLGFGRFLAPDDDRTARKQRLVALPGGRRPRRGGLLACLQQRGRGPQVRLLVDLLRAEQPHLVRADRGQRHDLGLGPRRLLVLDAERFLQGPQPRQLAVHQRLEPCPALRRVPRPERDLTVLEDLGNIPPVENRSMSFCFGFGWHARQSIHVSERLLRKVKLDRCRPNGPGVGSPRSDTFRTMCRLAGASQPAPTSS